MTKPLALPERQVTALAKGAAKAGCVAEVNIGGMVIRLVPKDDAQGNPAIDTDDDADLDRELAAFEAKHGDG